MNIVQKIERIFNSTVYLQAPLKAYELDDRIMEEKYGLRVIKLDYNNDKDLEEWIRLIHTSYDDCHFTIESARPYLQNHKYFQDTQSFVFQEIKGGRVVATVSIGLYKSNPKIGGAFRLGVDESCQGCGFGRISLLYGYSKLASTGIKYGESAVMFKRKVSLQLHYSLGFHPQPNTYYLADSTIHPWYKNLNIILKLRLKRSYNSFLKQERKKYRSL